MARKEKATLVFTGHMNGTSDWNFQATGTLNHGQIVVSEETSQSFAKDTFERDLRKASKSVKRAQAV